MGLIWSRFRGKQTTYETLEGIEKDINKFQKSRKFNQDRQRNIAFRLIIYSVILYIVAALVFFFVYLPDTWKLRILYSTPLLVFPIFIWGLKKLLHWYYVKRITQNDVALGELREKKKQILEDVMETETYNTAKKILEKFDPQRFKKLEVTETSTTPQGTPGTAIHQRVTARPAARPIQAPTPVPRTFGAPTPSVTPVRQPLQQQGLPRPNMQPMRQPTPPGSPRHMAPQGPAGRGTPQQQQRMTMATPQTAGRGMGMPPGYVPPPGPPMPRSVLPRDRGTMDRLMDYIVGDGPENRYALICSQCSSHNGMALKEEFEYLSFRCCYCYFMNPARKQRPFAPRMEFFNRGPGPQGGKLTPPKTDESEDETDTESSEEENEKDAGSGQASKPIKQVSGDGQTGLKSGRPEAVSGIKTKSMQGSSTAIRKDSNPATAELVGRDQQRAPSPAKRHVSFDGTSIPLHQPAENVLSSGLPENPQIPRAELSSTQYDSAIDQSEEADTIIDSENLAVGILDTSSDSLPPANNPEEDSMELGSEESFEELAVTAEDFNHCENVEQHLLATS